MKLTIEPTDSLVEVGGPCPHCAEPTGIICRVWKATTENGSEAGLVVAGVAVPEGSDATEFDGDLIELGRLAGDGAGVFRVADDAKPEQSLVVAGDSSEARQFMAERERR